VIFERRRYGRDNYLYLLADGPDAALVDPADTEVALELCRVHRVSPRWILHTHGHADHVGGSSFLRAELDAVVLGHGADAAGFRPDRDLAGTSGLELGRLRLRVHPAPGHTPGSVLLEWEGKLLTGDTLFWGGCGNCRHGGDPRRLARSFLGVLAGLDDGLEVHPGHDYAEANLPFVVDLEPLNLEALERLEQVREARRAGREPDAVPLGLERDVNPFLRAGSPEVRAALAARDRHPSTPEEAFVALRSLRDAW
jgi:hydroxyacylglutathione hydrolase